MGFNTVMIVMNDALHAIAEDPDFGKNVSRAEGGSWGRKRFGDCPTVSVPSGCHVNAAELFPSFHADDLHVFIAGWNGLICVATGRGRPTEEETQLQLLRQWAEKFGYRLTKVRKPR